MFEPEYHEDMDRFAATSHEGAKIREDHEFY